MDLTRLKMLIDLMGDASVAELDVTEGGSRIRLVKRRSAAPTSTEDAAVPDASPPDASVILSPLLGTCHLARDPDASPFVAIGDPVTNGQPLCVIEAMKVFHTVHADRDGEVQAILVTNGQEVEVGAPLFRIKT